MITRRSEVSHSVHGRGAVEGTARAAQTAARTRALDLVARSAHTCDRTFRALEALAASGRRHA